MLDNISIICYNKGTKQITQKFPSALKGDKNYGKNQ